MKTYRIIRAWPAVLTGAESFKVQVKQLWWWKDIMEAAGDLPEPVGITPQIKWFSSILSARRWIANQHPTADLIVETIMVC